MAETRATPKDRPIIFSAPMVRALLDGRKTQTRRLLKPQPEVFEIDGAPAPVGLLHVEGDPLPRVTIGRVVTLQEVRYAVGDQLWVRENFARVPASAYRQSTGVFQTVNPTDRYEAAIYAAGWERSKPSWKPCIHMPRWASRLTLVVTGVKVERLQDISEADAIAEGCPAQTPEELAGMEARGWFRDLWDSLHGDDAWAANPLVVVVSFTVHRANIDALTLETAHG